MQHKSYHEMVPAPDFSFYEKVTGLTDWEKEFLSSVMAYAGKHGDQLTVKQASTLDKIQAKIISRDAGIPLESDKQSGFLPIVEMLAHAKANGSAKWPKIHFELGANQLQLSIAGVSSVSPGAVNITDGRPYGQNTWYGRIHPDGSLSPSSHMSDDIIKFLKSFAANPARIAAEYGHVSGACCFCNTKITTDESVTVGYGPVCAKNFGLPWGVAASKAVKESGNA